MHKLINNEIKISVRNLVEFILKSGDIDNRFTSRADINAMLTGGRIHRMLQKSMPKGYKSEVSLKYTAHYEDVVVLLEGRADGIFLIDGTPAVDEIKAVRRDFSKMEEAEPVHIAQAVCYAFMYLNSQKEQCNEKCYVQITYCHPETEAVKRFVLEYSYEQLCEEFNGYIREYGKWAKFLSQHREERNASVKALTFPFEFRKGQKKIMGEVYKTILAEKQLFVQAPTGIGKTLSAVYPSIHAVGNGAADKIFYLTAKTITRTAAANAFHILTANGLKCSYIALTSKEKMCPCEAMECNPVSCKYAKGHLDRVNAAVFDIIQSCQEIGRDEVLEYAEKYIVCPFEFSLDITYWVDAVICDYNYVFDPHVRLQRFFSDNEKGDYIFLVDEAHNLAERARNMYSAGISKDAIDEAKKQFAKTPAIVKKINKCSRNMLSLKRSCDDWREMEDEEIAPLIKSLDEINSEILKEMDRHPEWRIPEEALDFYFNVRDMLSVYDWMDENYQIYAEHDRDGHFILNFLCVNPARKIQECCSQGLASIFFSATMMPIRYYKNMYCTDQSTPAMYVSSPFDTEKRLITVASDITTKYTKRTSDEYDRIAEYIDMVTAARKGNYLVFFPSYSFMEEIFARLKNESINYLKQDMAMTEQQKEEFLDEFRNGSKNIAGLCVMGGVFSEGIDLQYEALIGVIVVGTGLAQVSPRQEVLKRHFQNNGLNGFLYAYLYPGMNKVLQAAGRLIRTKDDYGVIVLMDQRFCNREYYELFPEEWFPYPVINKSNCEKVLADFWSSINKTGCTI